MKFIVSVSLSFCILATTFAQPATDVMLAKIRASNKEDLQMTMLAIASIGEQGLTDMAGKLAAPGSAENTRLEYALGSFSYYVTAPGNEQLRARTARAYCKALENAVNNENKAFIIRLLQITGTDECVSTLAAYLDDERLSDPAARTLTKIHSAAADKALAAALQKATGKFRLILVEALADSRAKTAAPLIGKIAVDPSNSSNTQLIKLSLYALARIADTSSRTILARAAGKANYENDPTAATDAYLRYAEELALRENAAQAARIAKELLSKATGDRRVTVRTAALRLLVSLQGNKSLPLLSAAMDDKDASYRAAALKFAAPFTDGRSTDIWLKKLNGSGPAVKGEIITMLGETRQSTALPAVLSALKDNDAAVRLRAIRSAGQIGQEKSLPALFAVMRKDDSAEVAAVKDALLVMKGDIPGEISHVQSSMPLRARSALMDIVAARSGFEALPAAQKLLILRQQMEASQDAAEKLHILREAGKCQTFPAIIFAGRYLDDVALRQDAALAVMNIALADKTLSGDILRKLLEKASAVLTGKDADMQRQLIRKYLDGMSAGAGIVSLFNGIDLTGWKGLVANPVLRARMSADTLAKEQQKADEDMRQSWKAVNGQLEFSGTGKNLCTIKKYADFEMFVDWKIDPDGDAGIYLRGSPQVQIWDTSRRAVGAEVGSGGLYNNTVYPSKPLKLADNAIGSWNSFHIIMKGDRVTVYLNGVLTVDNTILENYWDRNLPIFPEEQIELQAHGRHVAYRDLYIRELPRPTPFTLSQEEAKEGFDILFDGTNMFNWTGNLTDYIIEDDHIAIYPKKGGHGNLYTKKEYGDFVYRFEFQLTPGANNGIGIRAPLEGDAAYVGMEIQVLDNDAPVYKDLHEYQYHGSVYGVIPAKRGFLKKTGEWNEEEITATGNHIKVVLNGTTILDGDITDAIKNGTLDHQDHPGLKNAKGHLGFLGHGDIVKFRHMRVKDLTVK